MSGDPPAATHPVVLGIDPGLRVCGWGVLQSGPRPRFIASGAIRPRTTDSIGERLLCLHGEIAGLIKAYDPQEVAIEDAFVRALAPASALAIGQARAAAVLAAAAAGLEVAFYAPRAVKAAVSSYGASDKRQVQTMVRLLLALDAPPEPLDAADALAVALCHLSHRRTSALAAATSRRADGQMGRAL